MFTAFHSSCSPKVTRAVAALTAGSDALAPRNGAHTVYKIDPVIVRSCRLVLQSDAAPLCCAESPVNGL